MDKKATRTHVVVVEIDIPAAEYARFQATMPMDNRLPPDYAAWRKAEDEAEEGYRLSGLKTKRVTVHYDDFMAYVEQIKISPTYALLRAYAIISQDK